MTVKIWYRPEGGKPEVVDEFPGRLSDRMFAEYQAAYGVRPGDHRHGKDKLWMGRRKDEPGAG